MSDLAVETGVDEVVEPEGEEGVAEETPAPVVPAEPALDPLELQAELGHMREQYSQLYGVLEQIVQSAQQQAAPAAPAAPQLVDEYGNLNPAGLTSLLQQQQEQLLGAIDQRLQRVEAPLAQQQEAAIVAEGEQRLNDILADDIARNGEFASDPTADAQARQLVATIASTIFPELAERYGANPKAAELSMTRAAAQVRSLLQSAGSSAVTQTQNQLATIAGAHGEPGAHGAGISAPVIRIGERSVDRYAVS